MEIAVQNNDINEFLTLLKNNLTSPSCSSKEEDSELKKVKQAKDFLGQCLAKMNVQVIAASKEDLYWKMDGVNLLEKNDVQLYEPRGRMKLAITESHVSIEGKQGTCLVPIQSVIHLISVPNSTSAKKEGEELFAIILSEPVSFNNKQLKQLLFNLSKSPTQTITLSDGSSGLESDIIPSILAGITSLKIVKPQKELFQSNIDTKPFLRCYKGTQEGALYPLKNGILFVKPMIFFGVADIESLTAGRGNSSTTKYIDIVIESSTGKNFEFTNINREELPALQNYVKGFLKEREKLEKLNSAKPNSNLNSKSNTPNKKAKNPETVIDDVEFVPEVAKRLKNSLRARNEQEKLIIDDDDSSEDDEDFIPEGSDDNQTSDSGSSNDSSDYSSDDDSDDDDEGKEEESKNEVEEESKKISRKKDIKEDNVTESKGIKDFGKNSDIIDLSGESKKRKWLVTADSNDEEHENKKPKTEKEQKDDKNTENKITSFFTVNDLTGDDDDDLVLHQQKKEMEIIDVNTE